MSDIQMWRYTLPTIDRIEGWGIFLMDSTGIFAAVTDYGNYAYSWSHYGEKDFREFIIGLEKSPSYLLGKVARHEYKYDGEETLKFIKKHILEYRRDANVTREEARKEWDLLEEYELEYEYGFNQWYESTSLDDAHEFYHESYSASAIGFAKKLIPRLAELLRAELDKEGVK